MTLMAEPPAAEQQPISEAVLRRRLNRQAANELRARQRGEETERQQLERERAARREREKNKREISRRMIRRMLRGRIFHPIQQEYEYWLALRCGWDLATSSFTVDLAGRSVDAFVGYVWLWWKDLHYETRECLIRLSRRKPGKPTTQTDEDRHEIHSSMSVLLSKYSSYDS